MADRAQILDEARRLLRHFVDAGAVPVETTILQPAKTLLDLYGEDIRARAYVVLDPLRGELMMRPDFTVPVVQWHMAEGAEPARYTYSGVVFRRQEEDAERANEYVQVGFEIFGEDAAQADAEVFAAIAGQLKGLPLRALTGDIGILAAAVRGLNTTARRKDALLRHIWHPRRFRALLDRFGGRSPVPAPRKALLAQSDPLADAAPLVGLRSAGEIAERIAALREDAETPPIAARELALLDDLVALQCRAPDALERLRDLAVDMPAIEPAVARFEARLAALESHGIDTGDLQFETAYGRTSMEYYDGFVFGFLARDAAHLPPVATGGRYDALTARLGDGRSIPAVGAVLRPDVLIALKEAAA